MLRFKNFEFELSRSYDKVTISVIDKVQVRNSSSVLRGVHLEVQVQVRTLQKHIKFQYSSSCKFSFRNACTFRQSESSSQRRRNGSVQKQVQAEFVLALVRSRYLCYPRGKIQCKQCQLGRRISKSPTLIDH